MAKNRKQRRSSSLRQHKRERKILTPPLLAIGPISPVSYSRDFLPDLLWVAAMLDEHISWDAAYEPLDVIDRYMTYPTEGEKTIVDGRISMFSIVPEDVRDNVRAALAAETPWALADRVGHALMLYPDCPAAWLFKDWLEGHRVDPEVGLGYLKHLVSTYYDREDVGATRLRMVPIGRLLKNGKLFVSSAAGSFSLWSKYPGGLNDDEQRRVEASARAMYNMIGAQIMAPGEQTLAWPEHFWRQNWSISACDFTGVEAVRTRWDDDDDAAPPEADEPTTADELRDRFVEVLDELGSRLIESQLKAPLDLYEPIADEVKLGLASRLYRLAYLIFANPSLWGPELTPHVLRPIIDGRIVLAWLIKRNDPELFHRYRDYGMGRRKLFKLHLEDHVDAAGTDEHDDLLEALGAQVNHEIMEEFRKIDLGGNFAGVDLRKMAIEADLKSLYDLNYQPLSSEAHGDWSSLVGQDLKYCANPLHAYHRVGTFRGQETHLSLDLLPFALQLAGEAVSEVFAEFGVEVTPFFDEERDRLMAAAQAA